MRQRQLIVMLKEPHPGRVKTRLGREIGMVPAAWWFRRQAMSLIRRLEDPRWRLALAVSPDVTVITSRIWPGHLPRIAQGKGDLGARMVRLLRQAPPGPVMIIGADIPGITRSHIASGFQALDAGDGVIGPAPDGGYWMIGLKRTRSVPSGVLDGVRWSSPHAMADTIARLRGLRLARAATLQDVDTAADLAALR
ncbi:hypothetical protein CLV78_11097 [Aliiruegeria haliotis]|uniref:Glycosyltransferase n=1 Tax=Aliiruegeria haliotis TaxID=1280846 RepID=A0A2T0RJ65_9RHOB|nr:TIGR04282 family arsenosugar biosynthesis glycosyltransferase [Aliiruegeria haliotis]PRY21223.1 hypothetical protein CLV78_11097 [Aliiruegeria haliotis]